MEIAEVVAILVPQTGKNGKIRPNGEVERPPDRVNFTFAREFYFDPAVFPTTALRRDPCLHKEVAALHPFHTANFPPDLSPISQSPSIPAHHLATRPLVQLVFRVPLHSGVLEISNFAFFTRPGQVECPVKSISLVIRQKRNLLSLRYPAANANSLLSFFLFFFCGRKTNGERRTNNRNRYIVSKKRGWRNEAVKRRGKELRHKSWFTSMSVYTREFHSNFRHYEETCLSPG